MHTSLQSIGARSSGVSVTRATRGAEGKQCFQPAFQEASTKATEAASTDRTPAHDANFSYKEAPAAKSDDDEAATGEDASEPDALPTRTAKPVLIRPVEYDAVKPAGGVNKKSAGSTETTPVVANADPSPSLLKPPILRAIEFRAAPWTATEIATVSSEDDEPDSAPPVDKPAEAPVDDVPEEVSHSGSPGALVFQLSFQVPAVEAAAPEEVVEPTHFEVGEIKAEAIAEAMPVSADFTHHPLSAADIEMPPAPLPPARTEQVVRPAASVPEDPTAPTATGSAVQKMGLTIRGADDQVVRLQISQSNGSVRVAAHAEDTMLAKHLSASLPELVDRLDGQGYAPAVTSSPTSHKDVDARDSSGSAGDQHPRKQRERSKNAWRALASQLHDS